MYMYIGEATLTNGREWSWSKVLCARMVNSRPIRIKKEKTKRSHDEYMIQVDVLGFPDMNLNYL